MSSKNPTVVLVHGAFADSSSWNGVVALLQDRGYEVVAVSNPLRGVDSDAAYVASVAKAVDGPVVLVGHSYGGVLISRAAQELPNVDALVYIAAFQPDTGDSALGLATRFPGAKLGPDTTAVLVHDGEPELRIKSEDFRDVFAGDLPADTTRVMAATQRPVTEKALTTGLSGEPAWRRLPSWALVATQDNAIPAQAQEFMAERAGSKTVRVDASHAVAVSNPDAVADLILEAAKATA
ncbi:alpha/beta fold hydrolase [Saccharothrix deserti]|uniref:alpha/beta fold hydrolase n=1 Tax=Saccharothrix deserti TaxID=2593674 RepID=UPI00131C76C5|nr:alpha/beta hydrolase [Saccharothrix deserti]